MSPRIGLLGLFAPDAGSRRAFEETLADWREERLKRASMSGRAGVDVRGLISLLRVIALVAFRGLGASDTWKIVAATLLVAAAGSLLFIPAFWSSTRWNGTESNALAASLFLIPQALVTLLAPAVAFGFGTSPDRPVRVLSAAVLMIALAFAGTTWVVPASGQVYPELTTWPATRVSVKALHDRDFELRTFVDPLTGRTSRGFTRIVGPGRHFDRDALFGPGSVRRGLVAAVPTFMLLGVAIRRRFQDSLSWRMSQVLSGIAAIAVFFTAIGAVAFTRSAAGYASLGGDPRHISIWVAVGLSWVLILLLARMRTLNPAP